MGESLPFPDWSSNLPRVGERKKVSPDFDPTVCVSFALKITETDVSPVFNVRVSNEGPSCYQTVSFVHDGSLHIQTFL